MFLLFVMGALPFISAWTLDYWQAWDFLFICGASALAITLYLMKKDLKLLERRARLVVWVTRNCSDNASSYIETTW